ncbi:MAG TPA: hypothetical protein VGO83_02170 [Thermoleophilaceae bacterium]|nr:hypothetical protein [Thermoleophilaceae bacterium]
MSTTLSLPARTAPSRRARLLASATALVAAASVVVTLAIAGGGGDSVVPAQSATPGTAAPDRATMYRSESAMPDQSGPIQGGTAAERFHHFR